MAIRVKSFGMEIRPMKTMQELQLLDEMVNNFLANNKVKKLLSVSDASASDHNGETIGLILVIAYEE